ncbi:serine hydrolase [Amycolatopsis deserti]|uniref:Serine hydrolase n=1 Tax=Amycolatopsis deserti TaxID=185696 RepID=A0ABQ3IT66_9PSEU|nr:serine hydrolase domain-containing protein [Amycolatopsis deserti]GHE90977.1 serine hydrolase [Amycolatopsis deserti]
MTALPTRRSVLGLLGAAPVVLAAGTAVADDRSGAVPAGLRPGGELDRHVAGMAARDEFSGSLLLTRHGRTVLARSYGQADKRRGIPNGPDTTFPLASVTKLFTAVAVAQLAERGKLSFGAPISTYLDGFPDTVTVHHLLTHTSGYGDFHELPGYDDAAAGWTTREQTMTGTTELVRQTAPAFPPGAAWRYSNSGYHLLGAIVAAVSGQSYYDYVRQHVFDAAGMTRTGFRTRAEWEADRTAAHPYHRDASGALTDGITEFGTVVGTPAGDAFTTCADLALFGRLLGQERLLGHATTALVLGGKLPMPVPQPPPGAAAAPAAFQCYGPVSRIAGEQWAFGLGGGNTYGISTSIDVYPEAGWVLAVLGNYANLDLQTIAVRTQKLITGR